MAKFVKPTLEFPFQLHIGSDITSIDRIRMILSKPRYAERFVKHVLTPEELKQTRAVDALQFLRDLHKPKGKQPTLDHKQRGKMGSTAQFIAGRWAAKEAVIKAHFGRHVLMSQIEILTLRVGRNDYLATNFEYSPSPVAASKTTTTHGKDHVEARSGLGKQSNIDVLGEVLAEQGIFGGGILASGINIENLESSPSTMEVTKETAEARAEGAEADKTEGEAERAPSPPPLHVPEKPVAGIMARVTYEHHRQLMPVTISHMGDYATATCLAPLMPHRLVWPCLRRQLGASYAPPIRPSNPIRRARRRRRRGPTSTASDAEESAEAE